MQFFITVYNMKSVHLAAGLFDSGLFSTMGNAGLLQLCLVFYLLVYIITITLIL